MSAAAHDAAAAAEEQAAAEHQARYRYPEHRPSACGVLDVCWVDIVNPTTEHRREAERHRKAAADHRAASQVLRDAEARACAGLSDHDRDTSPFAHREDIAAVAELDLPRRASYRTVSHLAGATITFRAVPGMTAEWLQRVLDCHLARAAAVGHDMPEMPYCPLVPKGVTAAVSRVDKGFDVDVSSDDPDVAREILARSRTLVSR
jgi:hypothetical protein